MFCSWSSNVKIYVIHARVEMSITYNNSPNVHRVSQWFVICCQHKGVIWIIRSNSQWLSSCSFSRRLKAYIMTLLKWMLHDWECRTWFTITTEPLESRREKCSKNLPLASECKWTQRVDWSGLLVNNVIMCLWAESNVYMLCQRGS
jgi:hypothetical protein